MNENIVLLKKVTDHFIFIKKTNDLSDLLNKNLPTHNKSYLFLPLTNLFQQRFFIKKLNLKVWIKSKNKIAFCLIDKNFAVMLIIGVSVNKELKLKFSLIYKKNKLNLISKFVSVLINYLNHALYCSEIVLDRTLSKLFKEEKISHIKFNYNKQILTAGPSISLKEVINVSNATRYGWDNNHSYYTNLFEKKFADFIGVKYALATSSCTGALQIALMSLNIGSGDEVIVPDLTWVATATAVRDVGAKPVFADIEFDTWNISSESIEKKITKKTKAIIPVHLYGHPARMDKIMKISKKYKLKIVEDAAPSIGAEWRGKKCGTFGSFAAFSFQGAKLVVTGEGGMLVTNNYKLYCKAYKIWNHGRHEKKHFWIDQKGVKFKISNMQSAFGSAQIDRIDELIAMKRRIFNWYYDKLKHNKNLILNKEVKYAKSVYWMTSILLKKESKISRDELMLHLKKNKIDSRPVFPSISQYPIWYKKFKPEYNSNYIGKNAMNLPSGVTLSKREIDHVCDIINSIYE